MVSLRWGAVTDVGRSRTLNEDTVVTAYPVFAVADGMGGHAAGEVASQLTADHLADLGESLGPDRVTGQGLVGAIEAANDAIFRKSITDPTLRGMGTTVCALSIVGDHLAIANVGDSRVYTVTEGRFQQVSNDHSYVAELVEAGEITWAQARSHPRRNIVTRALGIEPHVMIDMWEVPAVIGDRFLLCSDGLVDEVTDEEITAVLAANPDPQLAAEQLVNLANHNGGHDNISVVVVDIVPEGTAMTSPATHAATTSPAPSSGPKTGSQPLIIAQPPEPPATPDPVAALLPVAKPVKATKRPGKTANRIRAALFLLALAAIVATVIGGINHYGRSGSYVAFKGNQVVVYQGRKAGVAWVKPQVVLTANQVTRDKLTPAAIALIEKTVTFTTPEAALSWINALAQNPELAPGLAPTTTTTTTTTVAPTTTTFIEPTTTTAPVGG